MFVPSPVPLSNIHIDKSYSAIKFVENISRIQILVAILAMICHVAIIPKYFNADFSPISDPINIRDATLHDNFTTINNSKVVEYEKMEKFHSPPYVNDVKNNKETERDYGRKIQLSIMEDYTGKQQLLTKSRALVFSINALLFLASGLFRLNSDKKRTKIENGISLISSITAILFCAVFFLPTFVSAISEHTKEVNKIEKYEKMMARGPSYIESYDLSESIYRNRNVFYSLIPRDILFQF